jgi:hypothetical protein
MPRLKNIWMMWLTIALLVHADLAGVEPNRYYQSVSDDVVDTLFGFLDNGGITEENAGKAVSYALSRVSTRGPIVAMSASNVDIKTKAACALLKQKNLPAIDKCREIIHDIDVVAAYWALPDPGPPVNTPAVVDEINTANQRSRERIDALKAALAKIPLSPLHQAADKAARRICNDDWLLLKRDAVMTAMRDGDGVPEEFLNDVNRHLTAENLLRPLVLSFMETMTVDELNQLASLDDNSAEMRAMSAVVANQSEIATEISFIISAEAKAWQAKHPATNP